MVIILAAGALHSGSARIIEGIFFNIPARRKFFLKLDVATIHR
jgi:DNA mismatch repair ATPase MutL